MLLSGLICATLGSQANSVQLPHRLEDCLPIPSLAQDIEQRREEARRQGQAEAAEPHIKLVKLTFRGQTALPPEELNEIAKSLTERMYNDNSGWPQELQERVLDAWQHRGYFKIVAETPEVMQVAGLPPEKRFAVSVSVDSGRLYRLNKIEIVHSTQFSPGELRGSFPIQDGSIFDTHAIQQGMEDLRKAYGTRGFINSTAIPSTAVDEVHGLITLDLEMEEGKRFRFGEIKVLGFDPLVAQKLLHESGLETGNIYDPSLVSTFFERNRKVLPGDAEAIGDTERRIDEQAGTVSITMDFRGCPQLPSDDNRN